MTGFRWTIKRKLLTLGAATGLPLLLLLVFWAWWEMREGTKQAEAELTLVSHLAASALAPLEEVTDRLGFLARDPLVRRRQIGVEELLRRVLAADPHIENVFAAGADGRVFASAVPLPVPAQVTIEDRSWFRRAMATGLPAVGDFEIGEIVGKPVARVAVPLREGDGPPTGVVVAALRLSALGDRFQPLALKKGMTLTLVDGQGQVLSHILNGDRWLGKRLPLAPALPAGAAVVRNLQWFEGGERTVAVTPVAGTAWRVLVGVPTGSLVTEVRKEILGIGFPILALLSLSSLIGLLIAQRVWRPLRVLADAAKKLPQGELRAIQVSATDEVGDLARAFNTMAAEVAEARARLEQQVAELAALTEAGRLLTGILELPEVLNRLIELARTRLGADVAGIWLREEPSGLARLYAEVGGGARPHEYRMRFRPGQGLVGWIMEHREPLVLADCRTDPRLFDRDSVAAEGLHSFLGVPILLEDVMVGVLVCLRRERREFSPADVALAQLFALPAAAAIRNARLFQESRTHSGRVEALLDLGRQISRIQPSQSVLETIVQACGTLLGTDSVGIRLVEGEDLVLTAAAGDAREARFVARLKVGESLAGRAVAAGEPLLVRDPADDPRVIPAHRDEFRRLGFRWLLVVPIKIGERALGVLTILTRREEGFSEGDVTVASAFASHAAIALENARLVEELNQALEELKSAQQQLVRSQTLRAVGVLAAGAAHHLNNLLAVILGNIQLLIEGVRRPEIRHSLELVEQTTRDAAEVVRRLHRFSRVEPFANMVPVDLNTLARELLEMTQPLWRDEAQARRVQIEVALHPGDIPAVTADPAALREVLMNLLINAIEALPRGGKLTIRTWRSGRWAHCAVADTGVGMSEEVKQRAPEPFFTTKGPKSTGLGLSVSHGILQRHGGELSIESAEGQGTTVTIRLPVALEPALQRPEPGPPKALPLAILLIEDDAQVRETVAKLLARLGHRVIHAPEGKEGLARLETEGPVDLVLTDLGMPGMTGWEVARVVKARWPHLPVGLVTGWGQEPEGSDAEREAVDFVISKPVTLETLHAALAGLRPQRPPD